MLPQLTYTISITQKLPAELRREIIDYFDTDPFTLLSLMQVNKHWHATLTVGEKADEAWKRRCLKMGAKQKSPKCKTWQETCMKLIRKKCAMCFKTTSAKLGLLLEKGPRWIVVCEPCQLKPGPYQVITGRQAMDYLNMEKATLKILPGKMRCITENHWARDYLLRSVLRLYMQTLAEGNALKQSQVAEYMEKIGAMDDHKANEDSMQNGQGIGQSKEIVVKKTTDKDENNTGKGDFSIPRLKDMAEGDEKTKALMNSLEQIVRGFSRFIYHDHLDLIAGLHPGEMF